MADSAISEPLYFFPDRAITRGDLKRILASDDTEERAWAVSHLLRYADWEHIWEFVTRDQVRDDFDRLDLPPTLRSAWARMLKIDAPVGR